MAPHSLVAYGEAVGPLLLTFHELSHTRKQTLVLQLAWALFRVLARETEPIGWNQSWIFFQMLCSLKRREICQPIRSDKPLLISAANEKKNGKYMVHVASCEAVSFTLQALNGMSNLVSKGI